MMSDPISTTDKNGWQFRAAEVLTALIEDGLKAQRHPLDWTITSSGTLRGEVSALDRLSDADRRAVYEEWLRVLNAGRPRESRQMSGGMRLIAPFTRPTNRGDVTGSISLHIDPAGDEA